MASNEVAATSFAASSNLSVPCTHNSPDLTETDNRENTDHGVPPSFSSKQRASPAYSHPPQPTLSRRTSRNSNGHTNPLPAPKRAQPQHSYPQQQPPLRQARSLRPSQTGSTLTMRSLREPSRRPSGANKSWTRESGKRRPACPRKSGTARPRGSLKRGWPSSASSHSCCELVRLSLLVGNAHSHAVC